jgi:hypothetical protein
MNEQETKDLIDGYIAGKKFQFRPHDKGAFTPLAEENSFLDILNFVSKGYEVRIKPEPRKFYARERDPSLCQVGGSKFLECGEHDPGAFKVCEVIK